MQPQLTRQNLVRVEIPVPSLEEQRRAAGLLDQVAAVTAKHRETAERLDGLVATSFAERFTTGDFPLVRLDSIADIHGGGRLGLSGNHFVAGGAVPAYGAGGLNGYLDQAEYEDRDAVILSARFGSARAAASASSREGCGPHPRTRR